MNILIKRNPPTETCTHGLLTCGNFKCFTLEDVVRKDKILGKTAIPAGVYPVTITYSNRFKKDMPLVSNVPNFSGVRIHSGNTSKDTEGCILVGYNAADGDWIGDSRAAYLALFSLIKEALGRKEAVFLEIQNAPV